MNRVQLPTHEEFELEPVELVRNPAEFDVHVQLPGLSDDELRHRAEGGEWDLYETHEIDSPRLSLCALRNRFDDTYRGDRIDEPGALIRAMWDMQRQIPNTKEFAKRLAQQGVLTTEEAEIVPSTRYSHDTLNDDEYDALRTYHKVFYVANAVDGVSADPSVLRRDADSYASAMMRAKFGNKFWQQSYGRVLTARGVSTDEVDHALDQVRRGASPSRIETLRRYGLSLPQAEQIENVPYPPFLNPYYRSAQSQAAEVLTADSLDTQIAARQFFGPENLVPLLRDQVAFERAIRAEKAYFSDFFIGNSLAGSRLLGDVTQTDIPFKSRFTDEELAGKLGLDPIVLSRLGSLATCVMREPALREVMNHHTRDMVQADYRLFLDLSIAAEAAQKS